MANFIIHCRENETVLTDIKNDLKDRILSFTIQISCNDSCNDIFNDNNNIRVECRYTNNDYKLFSEYMHKKYNISYDFVIDKTSFILEDIVKTTIYEKQVQLYENVTYCVEIITDNKNDDGYYSFRYGYDSDLLRCCFNLSFQNNKRYFKVDKTDLYWVMILPINNSGVYKIKNNTGIVTLYNFMSVNNVCDKVVVDNKVIADNIVNRSTPSELEDYYLMEHLLNKNYISCDKLDNLDNLENYKSVAIFRDNIGLHKNFVALFPEIIQRNSRFKTIKFHDSFIINQNDNNDDDHKFIDLMDKKLVTGDNHDNHDNHDDNYVYPEKCISRLIFNMNNSFNNHNNKLTCIIGIITINRLDYFKKCVSSLLLSLDKNNNYHFVISDGNYRSESIKSYNQFYEELKVNILDNYKNVNMVIIKNNIKYMYIQSNAILKLANNNIDFDIGFILNDDIIFNKSGWDNSYYEISKKYNLQHMCYNINNDTTRIINTELKTNGPVLNVNGVLLTFNKTVITQVGYFDEINFRVRGHSHIDFSMRCCKLGFNDALYFMDIADSNSFITAVHNNYEDSSIHDTNYDKDLYYANIYECDRRNKLIQDTMLPIYKPSIVEIKEFDDVFNNYGIYQLIVSYGLEHFKDRFMKMYNLRECIDKSKPCLFFGVYDDDDRSRIREYKGDKYVVWGGTDINTCFNGYDKNVKLTDLKKVFAISQDISNRLDYAEIPHILIPFSLVDKDLFKPVNNKKGTKIFIYDGLKPDIGYLYGESIYTQVMKRLPYYDYILSSTLNKPYNLMPSVYQECFVGLRLTMHDGNANMVQEMEHMKIPVIHNQSNYGLKWSTVDDVVNHINNIDNSIKTNLLDEMNKYKVDFFSTNLITNEDNDNCFKNLNLMIDYLARYKNILFICSDYPGYGGASTNCSNLHKFFENNPVYHNIMSIYYIFDGDEVPDLINNNDNIIITSENNLELTLKGLKHNKTFEPDIIILKNYVSYDLKKLFKCPILYFIAGIYRNCLDKHYTNLITRADHDEYINHNVLKQILAADYSFCNSTHTQDILSSIYGFTTNLFYSGLIPFYNQLNSYLVTNETEFNFRKYEYGVIASNFDRTIKNIDKTVESIFNKITGTDKMVILIGKNSNKYKDLYNVDNIIAVDLCGFDEMVFYYKNIKYVVQDSFYESCSNVKLEGVFNGCKFINNV